MTTATRPLTLTVIVPAHNEEQGLPATLESLLRQTVPAEEIIVIDDGSTDRTSEVAAGYGVTVLRPPHNLGSKAKAQNYALPHCTSDLVLAVDADTVLADDYIENIKPAFHDESVAIASGCVQSRFDRTWAERGRAVEYLHGFHWNRPIENMANSPVVCSGCCSVFRMEPLMEFGGFPERTIVEDMDYTWSVQIAGKRAVYVSSAVAWAADPENLTYFRKQVWRWASGFFQNVRLHYPRMIVKKPMLALWVSLKLWETVAVPLWLLVPLLVPGVGYSLGEAFVWWLVWWLSTSTLMIGVPLVHGARKRQVPLRRVLRNLPFCFMTKLVEFCYQWKALVVELVLVPLRLSKGMVHYEKGRADTTVVPAPAAARAGIESGEPATTT
ncbi:glycosyltransferase family 2 protein [Kitasatospora sp. NPDC085895]|uniref:glycosyltransferase family 2 protein n=1 Tax=Kitasatospora sp. NPDC085895 TaxID=3155057 RepID=UPI00344D84A4